jgi:hypothetical protein
VIKATPPRLYLRERDTVPIVPEAGWAPGPVWTDRENLAPTAVRTPDRPACSQSLYRLNHSGQYRLINFELFSKHAQTLRKKRLATVCTALHKLHSCLYTRRFVSLVWIQQLRLLVLLDGNYPAKTFLVRVISGFRRDVDEIGALLRCYAASSDSPVPTFRENLSVPSSRVKKS